MSARRRRATSIKSAAAACWRRSLQTLTIRAPVCVTSAPAYRACCLQGLGLIQCPRFGVASLLASGELVELLPQTPPPPMPVSVMFPKQRQMMPRVRVFIDWVVERVQEGLAAESDVARPPAELSGALPG